jgi:hypothetical protein
VIPAVVGSSPIVHPIESPSKKASARKLQQETFSRGATRLGQAPSSTPLNPPARKLQQESFSKKPSVVGLRASVKPHLSAQFYWSVAIFSDFQRDIKSRKYKACVFNTISSNLILHGSLPAGCADLTSICLKSVSDPDAVKIDRRILASIVRCDNRMVRGILSSSWV